MNKAERARKEARNEWTRALVRIAVYAIVTLVATWQIERRKKR